MPHSLAPPLPSNLNAETALLGSLCLDPSRLDGVAELVTAASFSARSHQQIFTAIERLHLAGTPIDIVSLGEDLEHGGVLESVGGATKLLEILEAVPHAAHARHYASMVRDKARHRAAVMVLSDGLEALSQPLDAETVETTLHEIEAGLHRVLQDGSAAEPQSIRDLVPGLLASLADNGGPARRIATGFVEVDQLTGGLGPGKLIVIGARTSHGKTALACSLLLRLAAGGVPSLMVSYEQPHREIMSRLLAIQSRIGLATIDRGGSAPEDRHCIMQGAEAIARLPIAIDDTQPNEAALAARLRLQARKGVKVAVIDYVGLVEPRDRRVIREQQIAGISRTLKKLALDTGLCIVALSQLNRGVEARDDKRPRLSDLRESGSLEQDADQVWLLHRPGKDSSNKHDDDHGELIVAKNRSGPLGTVQLAWVGRLAEYRDAE
jgi:replicative DNA helicase